MMMLLHHCFLTAIASSGLCGKSFSESYTKYCIEANYLENCMLSLKSKLNVCAWKTIFVFFLSSVVTIKCFFAVFVVFGVVVAQLYATFSPCFISFLPPSLLYSVHTHSLAWQRVWLCLASRNLNKWRMIARIFVLLIKSIVTSHHTLLLTGAVMWCSHFCRLNDSYPLVMSNFRQFN